MATISSLLLLGINMVLSIFARMAFGYSFCRPITYRVKVVKNILYVLEGCVDVYDPRWTNRRTKKRTNWVNDVSRKLLSQIHKGKNLEKSFCTEVLELIYFYKFQECAKVEAKNCWKEHTDGKICNSQVKTIFRARKSSNPA